MKQSLKSAIALVLFVAVTALMTGCAQLQSAVQSVPTEPFTASVCAEGAVPLPCQKLGIVKIPAGGQALAELVVGLAGPMLAKQANLKSCVFSVFPHSDSGHAISVTGTASCKLNGAKVSESVTVTLTPAPA